MSDYPRCPQCCHCNCAAPTIDDLKARIERLTERCIEDMQARITELEAAIRKHRASVYEFGWPRGDTELWSTLGGDR